MIRHLYPPLRLTAQGWYCEHCGTYGERTHVPGGEACRLLLADRADKMSEGW